MEMAELDALIRTWIEAHPGFTATPAKESEWASHKLDDLVNNEPYTALGVIRGIAEQNKSQEVAAILAAGPFENLLASHGSLIVDSVVKACKESESLRYLLGGIWRSSISDSVWEKLQNIPHEKW